MPLSHNLGFPHLGAGRELKRATEGYWSGKVSQADLLKTGAELRERHWRLQQDAGIDLVPSNDFSYYDRVLDTCALVGAVPKRYGWTGGPVDLDTYFAMARGVQAGGRDVTAMEMTKWFDTNYHYIVPEFEPGQTFRLSSSKPVDEFLEAKALGIQTKPVLIGPVTFLLLGKTRTARFDRLALLDALLPVYAEVLSRLGASGATWVQLDEPCLALDRTPAEREAFARAYGFLADQAPKVKLLVATYFGALDDNLTSALELPVAGLHVDAVRTGQRLASLVQSWPVGGGRSGKVLSLGVIDGRNIWKADLAASLRQRAEVRAARKQLHDGKLTGSEYDAFIAEQITRTLKLQEELGLDVLVHGEFERNDMVEYFGEQLEGFAFTEHGWVQSYGTRYVKPPIIYGDVSRPRAMTVRWSTFAQSKTARPVKGMLTGPVTILQWSFVRDDQPRAETAKQLALAIRDEVKDLEAAGIRVIQIDEPALREGLPLRRTEWPAYLEWAVNAFRLATASVLDATQIHTHMCYSEFNDVIRVIEKMDADVISIENARSGSELLEGFKEYRYPNEIGPGVYDIHSPRVPSTAEIVQALKRMQEVLDDRQIWVNPDCGLKTRGWQETLAAQRSPVPWQTVGKAVGEAIRAALAGAGPAVVPKPAAAATPGTDDDALYERVADLFESQVNPMVARHGGRVELIDVQDAVVMVRMAGGCQGCGMADVTLRQGIEAMLQQHVPDVKGVVDITDHAAGSNPYFAAAKK